MNDRRVSSTIEKNPKKGADFILTVAGVACFFIADQNSDYDSAIY
jgi:hypothetical protein